MTEDYQRAINAKTLECKKLRQVINELTEVNENLKHSLEGIKNHDATLQTSVEDLKIKLNGSLNRLEAEEQTQSELQDQIIQLQESNQKLKEDLHQSKERQLKFDEESAQLTMENIQLRFDITSLQQENTILKSEIREMAAEISDKDKNTAKVSADLDVTQQQSIEFCKKVQELTFALEKTQLKIQEKDLKIADMSSQIKKCSEDLQDQSSLENKLVTLKEKYEKICLAHQANDKSRDDLTEALLKNRNLSTENKKLKSANEKISTEKSALKDRLQQIDSNLAITKLNLENTVKEFSKLKEEHNLLRTSFKEISKTLEEAKKAITKKEGVEDKNRLLNIKCKAHDANVEELNQSLLRLLKESNDLKRKIQDLEESNVKKLNIIAKLKNAKSVALTKP